MGAGASPLLASSLKCSFLQVGYRHQGLGSPHLFVICGHVVQPLAPPRVLLPSACCGAGGVAWLVPWLSNALHMQFLEGHATEVLWLSCAGAVLGRTSWIEL